jgi:hypothetical protein
MSGEQPLDQKIVLQRGPFQRVQRWWRGIHPTKGRVIRGLTGWETVEEADTVRPSYTFAVKENLATDFCT